MAIVPHALGWFFFIKIKQAGASLAKLSQNSDFDLVEICLDKFEIGLSMCLNVFLKLTHYDLKLLYYG